ncbi:MAG: efflux RND transporter permease subunit [Ignavibacteria bacterium]|nr:efflux RND transporter permease subunit [Ignavibacteria bacterium]
MTITELSIKRPPLIIVIFLFLSILGIMSYYQLNYELIPDITPPIITVTAVYPGASPQEVESSVTKIIEESVTNTEKIKRVTSTSLESVSMVMIEFTQKANGQAALEEVQRRVNEILADLPKESENPVISKFSSSEVPILRISATSNLSERDFYQLMKDNIKPRLARLDGIGLVSLFGGQQKEIKVNLNKSRLQSYNLSALEVLEAIKRANFDFPAGKVQDTEGQYTIRLTGKINSTELLKDLVVRQSKEYGVVKVKDIAEVEDGIKEVEAMSRLNQKSALAVFIMKQNDANTVSVANQVKTELKEIEKSFQDKGVSFSIAQDASVFTMESANAVKFDLAFSIFLVGLTMLIFLHSLRNSIIIMVAIPCSLISTFIAMYIFNFTLNLMTLLALSLVIGILVDDSIVVLENIHRHIEMGKDKIQASIDGRNEIGFTALSITLVDVVVFLPLALISGLIGNLVRQFALVIVVSTLLSLFVSFTITPMLASRFAVREHFTADTLSGKFALWFEGLFERLGVIYRGLLQKALQHKILVVSISFIVLIGSIALIPMGFIGSEFLAPTDRGELNLTIELAPGAKLEETNQVARDLEKKILSRPDVEKVLTNVGSSEEQFVGMYSNNVAEMIVTLVPRKQRTKSVSLVGQELKALAQQYPGVKPRVAPIMIFGTTDAAPVAVGVNGSNPDDVYKASQIIEKLLSEIKGTSDIRSSVKTGKPEMHIKVNREKMAALGLSLDQVGAELRVAFTGDKSSKFRAANKEYDIRIIYDQFDRTNPEEVKNISFTNNRGQRIYLTQFAEIEYASGPTKLERKYRNPSITVTSAAMGRPPGDIGDELKSKIASTKLPSGIQLTYENDLENQDESFNSLSIAFLAAIVFVYLILAALYNSFLYPLAILFTIPLAVIGALLGLALTMNSLNIMSLLGMIVLIGLVGKNAILLVDRTNHNRTKGMDVIPAILEAAKVRLRPILMTTATLILGVMPIALSSGAANELKIGLAIVLIGGLTSSLLLTLIVVPVMYIYVNQMSAFFDRLKDIIVTYTARKKSYSAVSKATLIILIVIIVDSLSLKVYAQPVRYSLHAAVQTALQNNAEIKNAVLSISQAEYKIRESKGYLLPEINADGSYIRNTKLPVMFLPAALMGGTGAGNVPVPIAEKNVYEGNIKFSLPIYNAAIYPAIRSSIAEYGINSASRNNISLNVAADVKKAYYQVLIIRQYLNLTEQSLERARQRLKDARGMFFQGLAPDVDTLSAYIGIENIQPQLLHLQNSEQQAKRMLGYLMGLPAGNDVELVDSLSEISSTYLVDTEESIRLAIGQRPDLAMLELGLQNAREGENAAFAGHMPSLTAFGGIKIETQYDNFSFQNYNWQTSNYIGLQLSVPLFSGLRVENRAQQARVERLKVEEQLDAAQRMIRVEIYAASASLQEAKKNVRIQKQNVTLAERNYNLLQSRFRNGISKLSDLLDAELLLNQAKTNLSNEVYNMNVALAEFQKVTGVY